MNKPKLAATKFISFFNPYPTYWLLAFFALLLSCWQQSDTSYNTHASQSDSLPEDNLEPPLILSPRQEPTGLDPQTIQAETDVQNLLQNNSIASPPIIGSRVVKSGRKVTLHLRWEKVLGANRYHVQISRLLTFQRTLKDTKVVQPRLMVARLTPGVYFWRVSAIINDTESPFSSVQIVDATQSSQSTTQVVSKLMPADETTEAPPALSSSKTPGLPLRLVWRKPEDRSIVTSSPLMATGVATRGVQLKVNNGEPLEVTAAFSIPVSLKHGRNVIKLDASLGNETKSLERLVYYADPKLLAPIRERFEQLRTQLDEINAIREELDNTVKSLEARLNESHDQSVLTEMRAEVTRITQIRADIDREINRALAELDRLLQS